VHYAASGETYIRNEQYRDLRFWMVGTLRIEKGNQWVEYTEKLFRSGKLETTIVSVCRPISRMIPMTADAQLVAGMILGIAGMAINVSMSRRDW
jgi:hypothetical protein